MTLYEIDMAIQDCIDPETGEVNAEAFEALMIERDKKVENAVLFIKNLKAENAAIAAEIEAFETRMKRNKKNIEGLTNWLQFATQHTAFKTAKCSLTWRKSKAVSIYDEEGIPDEYFTEKVTRTVSKTDIKAAIENGLYVPGADIVINYSATIK